MTAVECRTTVTTGDFVLGAHRVDGIPVLPGAAFLDLVHRMLAAAGEDRARAVLRDIVFVRPLTSVDDRDRQIHCMVSDPDALGVHDVRVRSRVLREDGQPTHGQDWQEHLTASLHYEDEPRPPDIDPVALSAPTVATTTAMADRYRAAAARKVVHDAPMRCTGTLHRTATHTLAALRLEQPDSAGAGGFALHPALLDAATLVAFPEPEGSAPGEPYLLVHIREFRAPHTPTGSCHVLVPAPAGPAAAAGGTALTRDLTLYDDDGRFVAACTGVTWKRAESPGSRRGASAEAAALPAGRATTTDVVALLRGLVGSFLERDPEAIDARTGFYDLGLDSVALLALGRELEQVVGAPLYPTLLFEYSDITSLAAHLAAEFDIRTPVAPTDVPAETPVVNPVVNPADGPQAGAARTRCLVDRWQREEVPRRDVGSLGPLVVMGPRRYATELLHGAVPALRVVDIAEPPLDQDRHSTAAAEAARALDMLVNPDSGAAAEVALVLPGTADESSVTDTCVALWRTAQALNDRGGTAGVRLHVICPDTDEHAPVPAALAALARTITAETPRLRCRVVSAPAASGGAATAEEVRELVREAVLDPSDESEVRHEDGCRVVRRWLPAPPPSGEVAGALRDQGVYLITGGAGGLGRLVARHLVERYSARVVLAGRGSLPAELSDELGSWRGGEARYVQADITDPGQAVRVAQETRAAFGRINGVLHLAGVRADGVYPRKRIEEITRVLAPKVLGALHLDAATATDNLDFFALFSSLSAIVPNPGQCDYAAANAFLGAFAHRRAARIDRHGRTIAIDWTYWAEGGMRLSAARVLGAGRTTGVVPLPTDMGLHALEWVLHAGNARTAVLHGYSDAIGSLLREALPEERTLAPESRPRMAPAPPAPDPDDGAVAVIGMAGRYPGAPDLDAFWQRLVNGDDCVTEIPADRWDHSLYYDPAMGAAGRTYGKWGGFLDRAYHFDPLFFGISRREAERMDPQERLFLSTCWHALEDAGYPPHTLRGEAVGVFAGVMWNHYQLAEGASDGVAPFALHSSIPNRVSYTFDLTGPSIATDTSCSSSLTALHLAVESLRTGGSALALAGGVNVTTHPQKYLQLAQGQWLSKDGRCRSFGKDGTGYVPGEGVGALLLKPLAKARADGDHVYGVIRTTAINHAGRTGGATVPSPDAQARVVGAAIERAGWDPATVGYVEAHGTGTALGDPIEVTALARVFGTRPPGAAPCLLGSVKSNIGHLEGAAGIAGVTKVLLQLRHGTVAPSLHAQETNPHIDFSATPFEVPLRPTPWPRQGERALRAGVSAFGAGGSNAHVLIEEYVNRSAAPRTRVQPTGARLAVLSAEDEDALRQYARTLADRLRATAPLRRETVAADRAVEALAEALSIPPDARDPRATLAELGVDHTRLTALPALLPTTLELAAPDLTGVGLEQTLGELAGRCAAPADTGLSALDDITYTLQVGRTSMARRLAVVTDSVEHLVTSLGRYADGVPADRARGEYWSEDADSVTGASIEECVAAFRNGRPSQCAESWTAGVDLPWEECYDPATRPRRVPLPGYPFQEELCRLGGWRAEQAEAGDGATPPVPDESGSDDDAEDDVEQGEHMEPLDVDAEAVELRLLDGGIALVTLRSATFGDGMVEDLESAFGSIAENDAVRAVVLTGTGRMFSMGGDERALDSIAAGEASFSDVPFLYRGLARCDRPVICAMQGHAAGGGFTFGLHADIVLLAEEAEYRANFLSYGFTPGLGASHVLARRLGAVTAAEMLFTGRALRGGELAARGADLLVLKGRDVLPTALGLARAVAQHAPAAVRALKSELARRAWSDLAPVIESEVAMHREVLGEDARRLVAERFGALEGQSAPAQTPDLRQERPAEEPRSSAEAVRAVIEECVGEVLFLRPDEIDEARSLAEMGLDSVGAVELIGRLNRRLGTDLDSVTVYDHPTVPALTEAVRADLERAAALYREATASPRGTAGAVGGPNGGAAGPSGAGTSGAPVADADEASASGTVGPPGVEGPRGQPAGTPRASDVASGEATGAGSVGASGMGKVGAPTTQTVEVAITEAVEVATTEAVEPPAMRTSGAPAPETVDATTAGSPGASAAGNAGAPHTGAGPAAPPSAAAPAAGQVVLAPVEQAPVERAAVERVADEARTVSDAEGRREPVASRSIAVIGLSGRFPDAADPEDFWENLAAGRCAIREVPPERWDVEAYFAADRRVPDRTYSKWAALMPEVEAFDAPFFQLPPREAETMDPQQRLFLQEAWRALENAGYAGPAVGPRRWGVFAGCATGDYIDLLTEQGTAGTSGAFLGNTPSVLAARIAYLLDLTGPTLAVDTACSSSLVAVDLACASLLRGECETAIAGGVSVLSTPKMHIWTSKSGMLSPTGRCTPFAAEADGIVLGEAVGVVVLKPLDRAVADGDHIHGVILASGVNGDGRTNGITAPSATSQSELITRVQELAGIGPRDVGYVEAHGTGTELGDPIEVKALNAVFGPTGAETGTIGLGSVKGNIGHTTTAAGVAGLIKVLLALRHRALPPTLGSPNINPRIDLEAGPCRVVRTLEPWRPGPDGRRIAGLSSFGFSGTNCHLVIAEAPPTGPDPMRTPDGADEELIVVSGRTDAELRRRAADLAHAFAAHSSGARLRSIAHTLATGHRHHAVRAAFTVTDHTGLVEGLRSIAENGPDAVPDPAPVAPQDDAAASRSARTAADVYRAGRLPHWQTLFAGPPAGRVPLPPYPHTKDRYWPARPDPADGSRRKEAGTAADEAQETRTLRIGPDHWVVAGHRVAGRTVLPATATVCLAAAEALAEGASTPLLMRGLRWTLPLEVETLTELHLALRTGRRKTTVVLSTTVDGAPATEAARVLLPRDTHDVRDLRDPRDENSDGTSPAPPLDERLDPAVLTAPGTRSWSADELYRTFERGGLSYSGAFRSLTELRAHGPDEAIGTLLPLEPVSFDWAKTATVPHPAVLDGALQSVVALLTDDTAHSATARTPLLPFSVDEVCVLDPAAQPRYAHVQATGPGTGADRRFTVRLADFAGRVCVRLDGITLRPAAPAPPSTPEPPALYRPVWSPLPARIDPEPVSAPRRVAVLGDPSDPLVHALLGRNPGAVVRCVPLTDAEAIFDEREEPYDTVYAVVPGRGRAATALDRTAAANDLTTAVFRTVKAALAAGRGRTPLTFGIVLRGAVAVRAEEVPYPEAAAVTGLAAAMAAEYPRWRVGCLDLGDLDDADAEADRILAADWSRSLVAVRGRREYVRALEAVSEPVSAPASAPVTPWRDGGTYLILGGTGGLGFALSKHLARQHGARLVWLGRRAPSAGVEAARAEITALGGSALYLRADAADAEALRAAVVAARTEVGPLHGVVHAALDLRDSTLATMSESDLTAVLDAKTKGALALADAVRGDPLDFLVFFSSAVSFLPAAGQGNYAAASRFEDALALELRHAGVPASTVNWGYWGGVGAVATPEYRRRFAELGIEPIDVTEGLTALERVLASALPQTLVLNSASSHLVPDLLSTSRPTLASAVRGHAELVATARDLLDRRFRGLPGIPAVGEETTVDGLVAALHPTPDSTRLFHALLDILERTGTIRRTGDRLTLLPPDARRRSGQDEDLTDRHPGLAAHLDLLRRCVDALPDVLAGRVSGVEVLFPRGATDGLARVYGGNPVADHHHALLAEEVAAEAARLARREGRTARILEIGAGTGAGTDVVLQACAESAVAVRLHYTDVSPAFLGRAKERYRDRPEVTFGLFDVERDPREQDLDMPEGGYDMILAGNVLHATADLSAVLERVVSLLRPGGLLLVNEVTRADDFLTLTFGLTAGWWRFDTTAEQPDRLAHTPLLSPRQWRAALTAARITPERVRGLPGTPEEELAQAVFAARRRTEGARKTEPVPVTGARARRYVKEVFAEVLHFTVEALDETAAFDTFGIDSLVSLALVDRFERDLGELPSTLLFEHLTITDLAAHLVEAHGASLAAVIDPESRANPAEEPTDASEAQTATKSVSPEDDSAEPIAVIGVTGRYPGAPDLDTFWSKISEGADCVTEVPAERWDWRTHFSSQPGQPQRTYGRWGGFIDGVDLFDPAFFGILPRDAAAMDPQERLFLETSWTLLQDAGYLSPRTRQPSTGVFAGTMYGAYGQLAAAGGWPRGRYGDGHSPSWSIANRVSYTLDLQGPSFTVDSACSSSLTAVHLAVQSLRRGECRMAIAGGVNLILHPAHLIALSSMNMLSRDGACKVFDESADGFAPGEGVGAVLLKPLAAAQADGDTIWAVIRGSHVNAGGRTSGYTVPNPNAQADLVREAWRDSGARLRSLGYVEAHGTGTALGDPIEIAGLAKALTGPEAPAVCALGSVKANIGHLEGAAGIAGLTKVLLQLRHRRIAPCARLNQLNPKIELSGTPFHLPTELSPWPGPSPRVAGVSSFGAGGANAHLVIEEYIPATASGATRTPGAPEPAGEGLPYAPEAERWLLLSARTPEQLRVQARDLAVFLRQRVDVPLHEVAYTTQVGRAELPERLAVTAADRAGLIDALTAVAEGRTAPGALAGTAGPAGGLFDDEEGSSFVADLLSRGRPAKPARLWVDGAPVDWRGLWPQTPPRRAPLPPYPFERKRYWLPDPTAEGALPASVLERSAASPHPTVSPSPAPESPESPVDAGTKVTLLAPRWRPEPLPARQGNAPGVTLLLAEGPYADSLAHNLRRLGTRCVRGTQAQHYTRTSSDSYALDTTRPEDLARLVEDLHAEDLVPDAVVHFAPDTYDDADTDVSSGFHPLLWTARTLCAVRMGAPLRLVTGHADAPAGRRPAQRALPALLRTLSLEHSAFAAAAVTFDSPVRPDDVASVLLAEVLAADPTATPENRCAEVLMTQGTRYVRDLEPLGDLQALAPTASGGTDPAALPLREGGVYLLLGGTGALGRRLARHMTDQARVTVVLAGRSADAAGADSGAAEGAFPGSRIVPYKVDVADADDVRRLVADVRRTHGPLRGVIHAAGTRRDMRAVRKTAEDVAAVLGPKIKGIVHIDEATASDPLDFLVCFSSVAARTGNLGQADYAYANAYLDEFAARRTERERAGERNGRSLSVCWPLWAEGGMRVTAATRALFAQRWESVPLATDEGLRALGAALATDESCVVVNASPATTAARPDVAEPVTVVGAAERDPDILRDATRSALRTMAARFLLVDEREVDLGADLMDTGFDSISLTELISEVNERYSLDLLPTVLFECADLDAFARYLAEDHAPAVAATLPLAPPAQAAAGTQVAPITPIASGASTAVAVATAPAAPGTATSAAAPEAPITAASPAVPALPTDPLRHPEPARAPAPGPGPDAHAIAVIGIAGVLPGAPDLDTFWARMAAGDDLTGPVPADRADLLADPRTRDVRGGFLEDVRSFDAALFGISPREAALMDPQQRLFLQAVRRVFDDAGHAPSAFAGTATGVFAGVAASDYDDLLSSHGIPVEAHTASGVASCVLANRVSHVFDLRGPSEAVDTACSSALVAVHRAVRALRSGECEAAVAGGVNVLLSPNLFVAFDRSGMLSPDGRCKPFARDADGYGRGEGVGVVLLKPLTRARADGDHVYAVIRGSAVAHGGHATSLTAPNPLAQARVITAAHRDAGVPVSTVGYIETHGTGTRLGDPVEIEGLKKAFAHLASEQGEAVPSGATTVLGAVKSNIGHLEAAAGIAGLLKVVLSMRERQLPATLHLDDTNDYVRLEGSPFRLSTRLEPWCPADGPEGTLPLRAGVSSFGFGGTNAHVVLESADEQPPAPPTAGSHLLLLSAPDDAALRGYAARLAVWLETAPAGTLTRLAHTLRTGRDLFPHRWALAVDTPSHAVAALRALAAGKDFPGAHRGTASQSHERTDGAQSARPASPQDESSAVPDEDLAAWVAGRPTRLTTGPTALPAGPLRRLAGVPGFPYATTTHWFAETKSSTDPAHTATALTQEKTVHEEAAAPQRQRGRKRPRIRLAPSPRIDNAPKPEDVPAGAPDPRGEQERGEIREAKSVADAGVEQIVRHELATILAVPADLLDTTGPFADLGLDSIFRMELVRRLNDSLALDLKAAELYEHDSVEALCAHIAARTEAGTEVDGPRSEMATTPLSSSGSTLHDRLRAMIEEQTGTPLDTDRTFADNGLTSFEMLRVISTLEGAFGPLPKTLLFDHEDLTALAAEVERRFGGDAPAALARARTADKPHNGPRDTAAAAAVRDVPEHRLTQGADDTLLLLKRDLDRTPAAAVLAELDRRHGKENGLAGRDIAPYALLGRAREGYFHVSVRDDVLFAWSYVGTSDDFPDLAAELVAYARRHTLRPNFLSLQPLERVAGEPFTATRFGALQRLDDLPRFTLDGGRMSRLRYMVKRFERSGEVTTVGYRSGDDPACDAEIAELLDRWTENKKMVNPYIEVVREEIREGRLADRHRLFLTRLDGVLVNAIILTRIPSEPGYLLDLEFYPRDAPLGGLEHTMVRIIETLVEEGCTTLSLGASFGIAEKDSASPRTGSELERELAELRSVGIFGEGNFQFKNKFRPTNLPLYLCQPTGADRTPASDLILMIADPDLFSDGGGAPFDDAVRTAPQEPGPGTEDLVALGRKVLTLPHESIGTDFLTDSWAELDGPAVERRMAALAEAAASTAGPAAHGLPAADWLPFAHAFLVGSGRAAERLLCSVWSGTRGEVPHNGLFPTLTSALVLAGFTPWAVGRTQDESSWSGADPDTRALAEALADPAREISFVAVELAANASGGLPVSLAGLRAVRQLAQGRGVPLLLDATRVVENAAAVIAHEPGQSGRALWSVVRDLLSLGDMATLSLPKDFGVTAGALLLINDPALAADARVHVADTGHDLALRSRRLACAALLDAVGVAELVERRMTAVRALWRTLHEAGLPVGDRPGGHCVLLDPTALGRFAGHEEPALACVGLLHRETGVRGAPHLGDTDELKRRVRFAVPLGTEPEEAERAGTRIAALLGAPAPSDTEQTAPQEAGAAERDGNYEALRAGCPSVERHLLSLPDGGRVEAYTAGDGPALLLMAPFNIGAGLYAGQFAGLTDLYRLICVHHPGVGATTGITDLSLSSLAATARTALELLGEDGPVHVAGASFGGLCALTYALDHPDRCASLTLIGSSYRIGNRAGGLDRLDIVGRHDFDAVVQGPDGSRLAAQRTNLEQTLLRCESMDPRTGLQYLEVFGGRPDLLGRLGDVAVPTLIVQGALDTVIPLKTAHLLHGAIPDARYTELPGAGHFPSLTHATELNDLLAGFLTRMGQEEA